jgi:hypothetical protein
MTLEMAMYVIHSQSRILLRQTFHTRDRQIPIKWRNRFSHTISSSVDVAKPIGRCRESDQGFVLCVAHKLSFEMIGDTLSRYVCRSSLCEISQGCVIWFTILKLRTHVQVTLYITHGDTFAIPRSSITVVVDRPRHRYL